MYLLIHLKIFVNRFWVLETTKIPEITGSHMEITMWPVHEEIIDCGQEHTAKKSIALYFFTATCIWNSFIK